MGSISLFGHIDYGEGMLTMLFVIMAGMVVGVILGQVFYVLIEEKLFDFLDRF